MKQSGLALLTALLLSTPAHAQITNDKVKIGVLSDLSGIYMNLWCQRATGLVEAVKIAVEEFVAVRSTASRSKLIAATIRTKPDVGASLCSTAGTMWTRSTSLLKS